MAVPTDADLEHKELIKQYRKLLRKAKPILKEGDAKIIKKAFTFSFKAHRGMRRRSGEIYLFHPLAVAQICVEEIGLGTTSIVSALLHDTVEDTDVILPEIEQIFGKDVAVITGGLTKIEGTLGQNTSMQAENFHKMVLTLSEDVRVILVKMADRLHNMRTLGSLPHEKGLKIASETIYFYAPLAHRLGLNAIKSELEDLYLHFTNNKEYTEIAANIRSTEVSRGKFVKQFIRPIKKEFDELDLTYQIRSRPKSIYSIWKKMNKQHIPFDQVYDLFAVRIIVNAPIKLEKALCWQVYSIITNHYTPNPDRLRDWISMPRANGYESLHTTVMAKNGQWAEVQIRTNRMDEIAEKGYAAHWKYKESTPSRVSNLEKWLLHVRESLERKDLSALEWVDDFKGSLFGEEVFVFTPMGELKTFPKGATALDFAFNIHSDIGCHCRGSMVNKILRPINYILKNGDQMEIITSEKQKPSVDWLQFVKTSKARSKIRESLREEDTKRAMQGKEMLAQKMRKLKIPMNDQFVHKMITHFQVSSLSQLHHKVQQNQISLEDLRQLQKLLTPTTVRPTPNQNNIRKGTKLYTKDILLIGDNMDVVDYTPAKCCTPIPGDDVFGFLTVSGGIKIHRVNCTNSPRLLANYSNRIIRAQWGSETEVTFRTVLKIIGTDRFGLINDISNVISTGLQVNMSSVSFQTKAGIFTGEIVLYIKNIRHLDLLIQELQKIESIITVTRKDFHEPDTDSDEGMVKNPL